LSRGQVVRRSHERVHVVLLPIEQESRIVVIDLDGRQGFLKLPKRPHHHDCELVTQVQQHTIHITHQWDRRAEGKDVAQPLVE
jgi:hypothetical protein